MIIKASHPAAFLQGMGSAMSLSSSAVFTYNVSCPIYSPNIGIYWQRAGQYLYDAMETVKHDSLTADKQLSLNL
jgi:hypothetical protein